MSSARVPTSVNSARVLHLDATACGGGVAELRRSIVALQNDPPNAARAHEL